MRDHESELASLKVKVVIVTFEHDFFARSYAEETGLNWPLLMDGGRELYRAYGMLHASFWDLWGPESWRVYFRELLKGQKLHRPTNDIHQRGGDVLIDPQGIVRLHHVGTGPADRPPVETILHMIRSSHEH